MVHIRVGLLCGRMFYGNPQPAAEVIEHVDVVFYSVLRIVSSLQESPIPVNQTSRSHECLPAR
jgi:hypothetical protein